MAEQIEKISWTSAELKLNGRQVLFLTVIRGELELIQDFGTHRETQKLLEGTSHRIASGLFYELNAVSDQGELWALTKPASARTPQFNCSPARGLKKLLSLTEDALPYPALSAQISVLQAACISTDSPFFMNQLSGPLLFQALLAEQVVAETHSTLSTHEASPVFTQVESEIVNALNARLGFTASTASGIQVPGGSAANFMALQLARARALPTYKKNGTAFPKKPIIYVSTEAHYSFDKAVVAMGLGQDCLRRIEVDSQGRMRVDKLEEEIDKDRTKDHYPLLVCATAGTTVLGSFDPILGIAQICKTHSLWLHVDAAWGGPLLFSQRSKNLLEGIEFADSVTFDAHKFFGASMTCSFFLTAHRALLTEANDVAGGEYLFHAQDDSSADVDLDPGRNSWQCGRRADSFSFWAIWKHLGSNGLGKFIDEKLELRAQTVKLMREDACFEILNEASYLNVCFRVRAKHGEVSSPTLAKRMREKLRDENRAFINYSADRQGSFLRLILAHPYLRFEHIEEILQLVREAADALT